MILLQNIINVKRTQGKAELPLQVVWLKWARWCSGVPSDRLSVFESHGFAFLCPAVLPISVPPTCRFASDQVHPNQRNHTGKSHFRWKTAATILYILSYSSATSLHVTRVHTLTAPFVYSSPNLLTLPGSSHIICLLLIVMVSFVAWDDCSRVLCQRY